VYNTLMFIGFGFLFAGLAFLVFLALEKILVRKWRKALTCCICVTGTRGKSGVARLIGAGLRQAGFRVVVKTTGSKAAVIDPMGIEHQIPRYAPPSVAEQRRVLKLAALWNAEILVVETMSIRCEYLSVEMRQFLNPDIVVITNIRPDHVAEYGVHGLGLASALVRSIPSQATVICLSQHVPQNLVEELKRRGIKVHEVSCSSEKAETFPTHLEWNANVELALATCQVLKVNREVAIRGISCSQPDLGALKIWRLVSEDGRIQWLFVSAFAANDPVSTSIILNEVQTFWNPTRAPLVGILNLRKDRGDRTHQWYKTLLSGDFNGVFRDLLLVGDVPLTLLERLKTRYKGFVVNLAKASPEKITSEALFRLPEGGIVFGFGNIGGVGIELVNYWSKLAAK